MLDLGLGAQVLKACNILHQSLPLTLSKVMQLLTQERLGIAKQSSQMG